MSTVIVAMRLLIFFAYYVCLYMRGKMINITGWNWIVDKDKMICRNVENDVTISMKKEGKVIRGTISDMPVDLLSKIAGYSDGEKVIEKIVKMAEEEYSSFLSYSGAE